jgi:LmbE family N-acetylglucosaminyl deacetylase
MNYLDFVQQTVSLRERAAAIHPVAVTPSVLRTEGNPVMIFSPHPDDECIIGGFPLRLRNELGLPLINMAVTLGSNQARRQPRLEELRKACDCLGMEIVVPASAHQDRLSVDMRSKDGVWQELVQDIARTIIERQPSWVLYPHEDDWNSTHKAVSLLVHDAVLATGKQWSGGIIESEFWKPMPVPNVLVGFNEQTVADMINALAWHEGEVARNPYHLSLTAWMMDSVRRGAEWVGGQGRAAPTFSFGTLYRLSLYRNGAFEEFAGCPLILAPDTPLSNEFRSPASR